MAKMMSLRLFSIKRNFMAPVSDKEFLPAALEVLESPPSPMAIILLYVFLAATITGLAWAYFGHVDIVAVAQGKIQPHGRVKIVQPVETGKVVRIHFRDGEHVQQGDVLLELDSTDARADVLALRAAVAVFQAEIIRRDAAVAIVSTNFSDETPDGSAWKKLPEVDDIAPDVMGREQKLFEEDIKQLEMQLASLTAQKRQKSAERVRLLATIDAQSRILMTLTERVKMRELLAESGSGSKSSLIDAKEAYQIQEAQNISLRAQLDENIAALDYIQKEYARVKQAFITEYAQRRNDAARQLDEYRQRLIKSENRLANMALHAPISGTVQASGVYTVGQVVGAGQELMRVVPEENSYEVLAYFANKDIGFLRVGQEASIKVDAFPFTRYGFLKGRIDRVATDAIPVGEIPQIEGDPARVMDSKTIGGSQRVQYLAFPVTILLEEKQIHINGNAIQVMPGMTVSAEIRTGYRRIIEYVLSPIIQTTSIAWRER